MIAARARVGVDLFMYVKEMLCLSRGFEPRGDDVGLRRIYRDRKVPMTGAAGVSRPSPSRKTAHLRGHPVGRYVGHPWSRRSRRQAGRLSPRYRRLTRRFFPLPLHCAGRSWHSQIVGMSCLQPTPLRDRPAVATKWMIGLAPALWPAVGRVFKVLLPPIDGQVEQAVTVVHRLDAATGRPVGLEHLVSASPRSFT